MRAVCSHVGQACHAHTIVLATPTPASRPSAHVSPTTLSLFAAVSVCASLYVQPRATKACFGFCLSRVLIHSCIQSLGTNVFFWCKEGTGDTMLSKLDIMPALAELPAHSQGRQRSMGRGSRWLEEASPRKGCLVRSEGNVLIRPHSLLCWLMLNDGRLEIGWKGVLRAYQAESKSAGLALLFLFSNQLSWPAMSSVSSLKWN